MAGLAVVAAISIATPIVVASAADSDMQVAQAAPDQQGRGPMGGAPDHPGMGMMGRRGMMQQMMQLPPRQRCEERLARRAGFVAYIVAKLNLTPQQRPLWDKAQALMQTNADRQRQLCAGLSNDRNSQETMLDRMNRQEQFLTARLQGLQQVKPALEQLYQALSPEQKAIVDHPFAGH